MMDKTMLHEAMNHIDADLLEEALLVPKKKRHSFRWQAYAMAACFALVLIGVAAKMLPGFTAKKSYSAAATEMPLAMNIHSEAAMAPEPADAPMEEAKAMEPVMQEEKSALTEGIAEAEEEICMPQVMDSAGERTNDMKTADRFDAYLPNMEQEQYAEQTAQERPEDGSLHMNWQIGCESTLDWTVSEVRPADAVPIAELTEEMLVAAEEEITVSVDYGEVFVTVTARNVSAEWLYETLISLG